jgi:hypothetical protein
MAKFDYNSSSFRNAAIDKLKDRFGKKNVTEKMPTLTPKSITNENAPQKLRTGKFTDKIENLKETDKTYKEAALQKRPIGKVGNKFDDMISGDAESKKYGKEYLNMSTKLKTLEKPTSVSSSMQNKSKVLRTNSSKK